MIPVPDSLPEYAKWATMLSASLFGLVRALAGRKETEKENADTIECHDYVLDTLSDADLRGRISLMSGKDIRAELSVEEAEALRRDAERRAIYPRNN